MPPAGGAAAEGEADRGPGEQPGEGGAGRHAPGKGNLLILSGRRYTGRTSRQTIFLFMPALSVFLYSGPLFAEHGQSADSAPL